MVKTTTTITIDDEVKQKAKNLGLNLSAELERALREKSLLKKNLPEENIIIKCSVCGKEIEEGYLCKELKLVFCDECQKSWDMMKCHKKTHQDEHIHIRWPGWDGANKSYMKDVYKIK